MPIISVTPADIAKNKTFEPQWCKSKITKISDASKSSKGDSINIVFTFTLEGEQFAGKEIDHNFNSKGWFGLPDLHKAITGMPLDPGNVNTDDYLNQSVDVHIYMDTYAGRISNKIDGFLPYGKSSNATPF